MSDDASYAAFLQKANSFVRPASAATATSSNTNLFLQSESDEPWVEFTQKGSKIETASQFAFLVSIPGVSSFVNTADNRQYAEAAVQVAKESHSVVEDVQCVEINQGSRIIVYLYVFNTEDKVYCGLRSMKIET